MRRRIFGLLVVLTLLLALPFAAAAEERKGVTVTMTSGNTLTYSESVKFSVEDSDGNPVTNGMIYVQNRTAGSGAVPYSVSDGAAEVPASDLISNLEFKLDQPATLGIAYIPGQGYDAPDERDATITVNESVLSKVTMEGYTGYEYGKPVSGFMISNISAGAKVETLQFLDASGNPLSGNFDDQAYQLAIKLESAFGYRFPDADGALEVTLNGNAPSSKNENGFYVFQLDCPARSFAVTFHTDHGTAPQTQSVPRGGKAAEPTAPTDEDFAFKGWYTDPDCTIPFVFAETSIENDTTVYAKWVNKYTVTYKDGGHGVMPANEKVEAGGYATRPADPTEDGWKFKSWHRNNDYMDDPFDFANTQITGNTTLYAKWVETHTVTFDSNGHGTAPAAQTVEQGEKATKPADLTAEGYAFRGWYTTAACTTEFNFDTPIVADTTVYAKWDEIYTVTFNANGHGTAPAAQKVERGSKAAKPTDPAAKGWRFDGWYTDEKCTARYDFDKAVTANTTLYAKWTQLFTLTFETNGGTKIDSVEAPEGSLVYLGSYKPTKSGYYFVGWYTDKNLTQASRVSYVKMDGNKTVYAKFAVADKTNPKTADPALPGLALAVLSFSGMGLAAMGFKKRK